MEDFMIFADQYEIEISDDIGEKIVDLLPDPDELHANTLSVTWSEEAVLDRAMGMYWPIQFSIRITAAYRKRGYVVKGFMAKITSPGLEGCLVTFIKEP